MKEIQILPAEKSTTLPFDWGRLTWFADAKLGNTNEYTVGRCILKPGEKNPRHYHPNCEETLVVLRGKIRHTGSAGGGWVEMKEDDTVTIPPNVWHQAENIGDEEAHLFIVFSSAVRETVGES